MSKVVGDIAINVTADIGPLVREVSRAKSAVSGFKGVGETLGKGLDQVGARATDLGKKMSLVTAAMGAVAIGAFKLTEAAADAGDRIAKTARQAGVSAQYFQEMDYAIRQVTNLTEQEFDKALSTLNKRLGEAQGGSKGAIEAFEAIGISAADIASGAVTTEQAMNALVTAVSEAKDPSIAAAVATDLLGKAGAKLGGQLSGAAGEIKSLRDRANELGIVMDGEALAASEQFGDKMDDLSRSFEALKVKVASELLPVFVNTLIPALQDQVIPAIAMVAEKVGDAIDWFGQLPGPVQEAAAVIAGAFAAGGPVLLAIGATSAAISALIAATGPIGLLIGAAALITAAWVTWGDDIKAAIGPALEWITEKFNQFLGVLDTVKTAAIGVKDAVVSAFTLGDSAALNAPVSQGGAGSPFRPVDPTDPGSGNLGANIVDGMVNGLQAQIDAREGEIREQADRFPQMFREQLQIQSPSKVFADIGAYVGQGFAEGIASTQALVAQSVATMGETAITSTDNTAKTILGTMSNLFQNSKPIAAAQALVNAYQGATEALKLPFPKNLAAFASVLATGLGAVRSIKGASVGGGGGSPSAAVASGAGAAAAGGGGEAAPDKTQVVNVSLVGDVIGRDGVRALFAQINDGVKKGYRITGLNFQE